MASPWSKQTCQMRVHVYERLHTFIQDLLEGLFYDYEKMADQGRSDRDVIFTMIFCTTNLFIW